MLLGYPLWLFALAAIGIPVLIHLWTIRPGRTVKVGSISLFKESSPKSSRSFKLTDLLLLALRCLLLVLIAVLLAGPIWRRVLTDSKTKGWVLIPKAGFSETYNKFQPKIDSLIKSGFELHYFGKDFKKVDLQDTLEANNSTNYNGLNYWTLIRQLQAKAPSGTAIHLFTPNTINHFEGNKPTTSLKINCQTYTPTDSVSKWPVAAWVTPQGYIRLLQGTSTSKGTSYDYVDLKSGSTDQGYKVEVQNGIPLITSVNDPSQKIIADTATRRMAIMADKDPADANYLQSALQAVAQLTQQKTDIRIYQSPEKIPAKQDRLFWLSDKPLVSSKTSASNIVKYDGDKASNTDSWLINRNNDIKIDLHRKTTAKPKGETIWSDGHGGAILSKETGKTNIYHFYSRFNPQWSGMVWSDEFPKWIMELTNNIDVHAYAHERRALSDEQIRPIFDKNAANASVQNSAQRPLDNYLWIALIILFIGERWLATRNNRSISNG